MRDIQIFSSKFTEIKGRDASSRSSKQSTRVTPNSSNTKSSQIPRIQQFSIQTMLNTADLISEKNLIKTCATISKTLIDNPTFVMLRKCLEQIQCKPAKEKRGELEKNFSHPISFMIIDELVRNKLLPQNFIWIPEPLTPRAGQIMELCKSRERSADEIIDLHYEVVDAKTNERSPSPKNPKRKKQRKNSSGTHETVSRKPDGTITTVTCNNPVHIQKSAIFLVELKREMNDSTVATAMVELQKDFVFTEPWMNAPFGLIGDGIKFRFCRTEMKKSLGQVDISSAVSSEVFNTQTEEDLTTFLCTLVQVLVNQQTLKEQCAKTERPELELLGHKFTLVEHLCLNKRSFVGLFDCNSAHYVLKFCFSEEINTSSIVTERTIFKEIIESAPNAKEFLPTLEFGTMENLPFLIMTFEGPSLESYCKSCGDVELYEVVKRDITSALNAFHEAGYAFVDIHPGNIVLSRDGEGKLRAKLLDLESVRPLNKSWDDNAGCKSGCSEKVNCWKHTKPASRGGYVQIKGNKPTRDTDLSSLKKVLDELVRC